jgi:hypothetical protein
MSLTDFRAKLSASQFAQIPSDEKSPIDHYYGTLVDQNNKFKGIRARFTRGHEDINLIRQLTKGQQLLILLGVFDGQVSNGGIAQFFWNYPEYLFDVRDAIEHLGDAQILSGYERVVEALIGSKEQWVRLRQQWKRANGVPDWEAFSESCDLLDADWFDDAYFDKHGYNDKKEWGLLERGLRRPFLERLANYIRSHRSEFIEE